MNKRLIYILIMGIIMASCSGGRLAPKTEQAERNDISDKTVVLDMEKHMLDSFPLSKLIKDVRYVQLETSLDACLTLPMNVKNAGGVLYVSDLDEQLFCFNQNGTFLRRAFQRGKGSGEVLRLYDYDVDDSLLYVLDGARSAIMTYSHDGTFVACQNLPFRAISFAKQEYGYVFHLAPYSLNNGDNKDLIAVTDEKFNPLYTAFEYDSDNCIPATRTPYFSNGNESLLYAPIYGRSIYSISEKNVEMLYYLSFNSPYYEQNKQYEGAKESAEEGIYYSYNNPIQAGKFLIQAFSTSKDCKGTLLINRESNKYVFIKDFVQDTNRIYRFSFEDVKYYDRKTNELVGFANTYYTDVHTDEIKEIKASMKDSVANILIKKSVSFSENPLLIFYRLCSDAI